MKKFSFITFLHYVLFSTKIVSQSSFCFAPATAYYGGPNTFNVASGDFNNDGIKDLASTHESGSSQSGIMVMYGIGNGTFGPSINYSNGGVNARSIVSADFNNDGISDIAVPNGNYKISVFLGTNTGTLSPMIISIGGYAVVNGITAADFNNDNKIDIAVTNSGSNGIAVLLGLGNGSFSSQSTYLVGYQSSGIVCGDFNNDGNKDLATCDDYAPSGSISVVLGDGTGSFAGTGTNYFNYTVDARPQSLCTKDFNGDGKSDIAVTSGYSGVVSVFLSSSAGLFLPKVDYPISSGSTQPTLLSIVSNDFDGDNVLDLAIGETAGFAVCLGTGGGTFGPPSSVITNTISYDTRKACTDDFDGDTKPDIVMAGGNSSNVLVFLHCVPLPIAISDTIINCSCFGICDGSTIISTTGGISPYTVNVSNGVTYTNTTGLFTISNLCSGVYSFTVTDDLSSFASNSISISQPTALSLIASQSSYAVCADSCVTMQVSASGGTPPYSYYWSVATSTTYSNTICPSSNPGIQSAYINDANNCSTTQTIAINVDTMCHYDYIVWPGDANRDGTVNNIDLLELGLHYTQSGPPRASISNTWQSYPANNWTGTVTNGWNLKHSDCNGDGIINASDTLAIYNNYNNAAFYKHNNHTNTGPELTLVPDQPQVFKGQWGTSSIYFGDSTNQISSVNGIAYTVYFDNYTLVVDSIYIVYENSFLDVTSSNLKFQKIEFLNGLIYTATTHTNNINSNGNGKIATLHYKIRDDLTTNEQLYILLSTVNKSNNLGVIAPLSGGWTLVDIVGATVGLKELSNDIIYISPNPTNGLLTIHSKTELQKIEVISITGQVLVSEFPMNVPHTMHLENFANGIYFVNVYQYDRVVKREKIVLSK